MGKPTVLLRDPTISVASCGVVLVNSWHRAPTVAALESLLAVSKEHCKTHGKHVPFSMIDPRAGRTMPDDSRERARSLAVELQPHTLFQVFCFMGGGFFASAARAILTGIQLYTRPPFPWKVFNAVPDATRWTHEQLVALGKASDEGALGEAIAAIRDAPDPSQSSARA